MPLDDGPRDGTEHWREIAGVGFCHWDRWLLTLALPKETACGESLGSFASGGAARTGLRLVEPAADVAIRELARIILGLRRAELDYQLGKACRLHATIVSSANEATGADL
jgi:hypothetical protein